MISPEIRDSSSPQPSGHAGMLLCEVNTWLPRCCTVEEANAPRCTVRTRKGMALYMPAGIYISCCRKMVILQTTVPYSNVTLCALPFTAVC